MGIGQGAGAGNGRGAGAGTSQGAGQGADLSSSIRSTASRVHYDPRMFSTARDGQAGQTDRGRRDSAETEYFENMSRFYGEMNAEISQQVSLGLVL